MLESELGLLQLDTRMTVQSLVQPLVTYHMVIYTLKTTNNAMTLATTNNTLVPTLEAMLNKVRNTTSDTMTAVSATLVAAMIVAMTVATTEETILVRTRALIRKKTAANVAVTRSAIHLVLVASHQTESETNPVRDPRSATSLISPSVVWDTEVSALLLED